MFITEATTKLNMTEDDLRMSLMGVRDDWDSCQEINDSEYQLISQSVGATALPPSDESTDSAEIQPVADMPIEKQQTLIDNVSQILGQELILSVQERIQIASAVDEITNQVILTNRETSIRNLGQEIAAQDEQIKAEYAQVIVTLQGLIKPTPEAPKRTGMDEFNNAIANIQKKLSR
mgnify:CR=1 FL=1